MFGSFYFAQLYFAGSLAAAPASSTATGYPFGEDLSIPSARIIPHFDHVRAWNEDDEDLMTISQLWLTRK